MTLNMQGHWNITNVWARFQESRRNYRLSSLLKYEFILALGRCRYDFSEIGLPNGARDEYLIDFSIRSGWIVSDDHNLLWTFLRRDIPNKMCTWLKSYAFGDLKLVIRREISEVTLEVWEWDHNLQQKTTSFWTKGMLHRTHYVNVYFMRQTMYFVTCLLNYIWCTCCIKLCIIHVILVECRRNAP